MKVNETDIQAMVKFEGLSFAEAKLTYKRREKLPSTAFCGPNRTYPAHDAKHVRNALARLSQFGKRLKPAVRASILTCLKRRAKRFNIEVGETVAGKLCLIKFDETLDEKTRKKWEVEVAKCVEHYFFSEANQNTEGKPKESAKYKIVKNKAGKFDVMIATGKKFPPWKIVKTFDSKPDAVAFIQKQTKK